MKKFLFSCENDQEYSDLSEIMREIKKKGDVEILYFNLGTVPVAIPEGNDDFTNEYMAVRLFKIGLKELPPVKKFILSLVNAVKINFICFFNKVDSVVIGVPLLTFRLARLLSFRRVRYISYIRGVIAQSTEKTSLSSHVFLKYQWLGRINWVRSWISDYYSNVVICIGESTKRFLITRFVPEDNIKVIGSIYCDSRRGEIPLPSAKAKTIVFVSSAFEWHGDLDAHKAQTSFILRIKQHLEEYHKVNDYNFIIRIHPRESLQVYRREGSLLSRVDCRGLDPIKAYPKNTLFISPVSSLIFELNYLGRQSRIVSDKFFTGYSKTWVEAIGIKPVNNWKDMLDSYILNGDVTPQPNLDDAISKKHYGNVSSKIIKIVYEC